MSMVLTIMMAEIMRRTIGVLTMVMGTDMEFRKMILLLRTNLIV